MVRKLKILDILGKHRLYFNTFKCVKIEIKCIISSLSYCGLWWLKDMQLSIQTTSYSDVLGSLMLPTILPTKPLPLCVLTHLFVCIFTFLSSCAYIAYMFACMFKFLLQLTIVAGLCLCGPLPSLFFSPTSPYFPYLMMLSDEQPPVVHIYPKGILTPCYHSTCRAAASLHVIL